MSKTRKTLYRFYERAADVIAPGLRNSQHEYRAVLQNTVSSEVSWLDLGCGHQLFPAWMATAQADERALIQRCGKVVGIDADFPSVVRHESLRYRLVGDIQELPFAAESFDLVTANMVVEHVRDPERLLAEVRRVLKPGGKFIFHTPNAGGYTTLLVRAFPSFIKEALARFFQNRGEEDVFPTFYRMNSRKAIDHRGTESGLRAVDVRMLESSAQTIMLGPVVLLELMWIRLLRAPFAAKFRTNIIACLQKPGMNVPAGASVREVERAIDA